MNRKFFGDTRDLFKFDLVRHLMKSLPELAGFAFVPMLTDTSTRGTKKSRTKTDLEHAVRSGKAGSQNQKLREQLSRLQEISGDREYLSGVSDYFSGEKSSSTSAGTNRLPMQAGTRTWAASFHHFRKKP